MSSGAKGQFAYHGAFAPKLDAGSIIAVERQDMSSKMNQGRVLMENELVNGSS